MQLLLLLLLSAVCSTSAYFHGQSRRFSDGSAEPLAIDVLKNQINELEIAVQTKNVAVFAKLFFEHQYIEELRKILNGGIENFDAAADRAHYANGGVDGIVLINYTGQQVLFMDLHLIKNLDSPTGWQIMDLRPQRRY